MVPTPLGRRLALLIQGPLQVVLWLGLGAGSLWLADRRPSAGSIRGHAVAPLADVLAAQDGRVAELLVETGAEVAAGDVVARLDGGEHDADLQAARAELAALAAEIQAASARQRLAAAERSIDAAERRARAGEFEARAAADEFANRERRLDRAARLEVDVRRLQLSLETTEAEQAGRRLALARVDRRLERARQLAESGVDRVANVEDLELEAAELQAEIDAADTLADETRGLVAAASDDLRIARDAPVGEIEAGAVIDRGFELERSLETAALAGDEAELAVLERRVEVARARLDALEQASRNLELVAPIPGRVIEILASPGAIVLAGNPVARLRTPDANEVVVYLAEAEAQGEVPERLRLSRNAGSNGDEVLARVLRIGDAVEPLPAELWLLPTQPEYGRPIVVENPPGLALIAGEKVRARR